MSVQCSLYVASQAEVAEFREQGWVPDDWVLELGEDRIIDLDKNWQVIGTVLGAGDNGDVAAQSLTGGEPIGDPDYTGFGPARLIEPSHARELSTVLADIDEAEFRRRADRADLWTTYGVAPEVSVVTRLRLHRRPVRSAACRLRTGRHTRKVRHRLAVLIAK